MSGVNGLLVLSFVDVCHAGFVVAVNDILPHVMAVLEAEPEEEAFAKASAPPASSHSLPVLWTMHFITRPLSPLWL